MAFQLEFCLDEKSELSNLLESVKEVKESSDKVRKSMFARHSDLARKYMDLHERMQIIERNICHQSSG